MAGLPLADELLELLCHELGAVVADDARPGMGILFTSTLQHNLRVGDLHALADVPGHNHARTAIQRPEPEVKGACGCPLGGLM